MRPDRLHPGIDCLNFRHHRPRQQLFRVVPARSVFGQVDGQHLPACGTGGVCKALSLFLAAIFPVDIKIHLAAALAVQDGRNARKGKLLFFHGGHAPLSPTALRGRFFFMITQSDPKHKQKRGRSTFRYCGPRFALEVKLTSPCLQLQQRSHQHASPGPHPSRNG